MNWSPRISLVLAGALCGFAFSVPVIVLLSVITVAIAAIVVARTFNAELAFATGIISVIAALWFNLSMWLVAILLNGLVDFTLFSWIAR